MKAAVPPTRRDVAFAGCLAVVLASGVLSVLLLNTSMQQQADLMSAQRQHMEALTQEQQSLQVGLDRLANPTVLATKARQLHLRPAGEPRYVDAGTSASRHSPSTGHLTVSGRGSAAARVHAG